MFRRRGTASGGFDPAVGEAHRSARLAQWGILFLGIYILIASATGLFLLTLLIRTQERIVPEYLELVGRTITEPPRDYFWVLQFLSDPETGEVDGESLAFYQDTIDWQNITSSLLAAGREEFVINAALLNRSGEILIDDTGTTPPAEHRGQHVEPEREAIARAIAGETLRLGVRRLTDQRVVYMPVRYVAEDGSITIPAVLRLEADPVRFRQLAQLRNRLFIGFWIAAAVIVFLYVATVRLVRRTIEAERAASQADRLRALGTMTAGIAHEIRNPLGIMTLQLEELRAALKTASNPSSMEAFDAIASDLQDEARRLKSLTEEFVHFTGAGSSSYFKPVPVDVCDVIRQLLKLWTRGLDTSRRSIHVSLPDHALHALFTEDRLRQILLNLLRNADEALGERAGNIWIDVKERHGKVAISVIDDGPGIPASIQRQVFDPFFTTRAEGTGLGLSLSRSLAQAAGGDLTLETTPDRTTRFSLTLPMAPKN